MVWAGMSHPSRLGDQMRPRLAIEEAVLGRRKMKSRKESSYLPQKQADLIFVRPEQRTVSTRAASGRECALACLDRGSDSPGLCRGAETSGIPPIALEVLKRSIGSEG